MATLVMLLVASACRRPARPAIEVDSYETNTWVGTTTTTIAPPPPRVGGTPTPPAAGPTETPPTVPPPTPPASASQPRGFEPAKPW
jgi:hypothetical protein